MSVKYPWEVRQPIIYLLLASILVAGFVLRTWNINFDRGIGSHPDERSTACFYAPGIQLPASWELFTDPTQSPLNPLWDVARQERRGFTYGHFPLYLGVAMGEALHRTAPLATWLGFPATVTALMTQANQACGGVAVAGRLLMALLDTLTILLLFFLGRRVYSPMAGLLTSAFYAFTAQAIQLSHFFAMDPASTTFTVLAVLGGVMMAQDRSTRAALVTGLGAGLAISSKFSALPVLAVPFVAAVLVFWDVAQTRAISGSEPENGSREEFRALMGVVIALAVALLAFAATSPYAVLDWENFITATLVEQGRMVRGVADFPFTRQYRNTWPYVYFIDQQLRWGLGLALGAVVAAGTLVALANLIRTLYAIVATVVGRLFSATQQWRAVSPSRQFELLVWAWLVPYFGLTGAFLAKFNRYMLPMLPFVALFAAGMIWRLWWWGEGREPAQSERGRANGEAVVGADELGPNDASQESVATPASITTRELHGVHGGPDTTDEPVPVAVAEEQLMVTDGHSDPTISPVDAPHALRPSARASRVLALFLATLGLVGGLFWSLAYVNGVYDREHTWITASRWIYENVPAGSAILWEVWDDALPKALPGEPGMDMGSTKLFNIDWSPYEEDTAEKYSVMRQKLQEADFVVYSSKRIYDSVDELPERYPMTNRYYQAMWDGSLGFELALEQTSPPSLLGFTFDDRGADESWSLYDHPQVTVFRKVNQLNDEDYDALFAGFWDEAIPWYRGEDSPLSPLLNAIGLGHSLESEDAGLINRALGAITGDRIESAPMLEPSERASLELPTPLSEQPVIASYRWNRLASENVVVGIVWWWFVLALLGWFAWPMAFSIFRPLRDRGYLLCRGFGWLLAGWLLWWLASLGWLHNTTTNAWIVALFLGTVGGLLAYRQRATIVPYVRHNWGLMLTGEAVFAAAYLLFVLIRMGNPDLWQPWLGGEKFMEFAFLNGVLRSPTFPPLDPHFANGYINYYYFGIYLVAYLIKLTGIHAEVAFNLAIPTLFALTATNAFSVAYSAVRAPQDAGEAIVPERTSYDHDRPESTEALAHAQLETPSAEGDSPVTRAEDEHVDADDPRDSNTVAKGSEEHRPQERIEANWSHGIGAALLAPLFVVFLGNLDGFAQVVRMYAQRGSISFPTTIPGLGTTVRAVSGVVAGPTISSYDFWGPSRVIPHSINEFPFWSFLFADLHPHLIGIPFSLLFLALVLTLLHAPISDWVGAWRRGLVLTATLSLMLGTLATVNLWELPTYLGLGLLAFIVSQYYRQGRIHWGVTLLFGVLYGLGAYIAYWPFFSNYVNVGASGFGLVRDGDDLGLWILIWGFFLFVLVSWLVYAASRPARVGYRAHGSAVKSTGIERAVSLGFRQYDRLPRVVYLHSKLVKRPTLSYQLGLWLLPIALIAAVGALWWGRAVLALCLPLLALATLLLWRRGRSADAGSIFAALLTATGLAILAGTQVVYLKDFLQGGDWYRMNTLFKFFSQVWVIWGVAAAVALPRLWTGFVLEKTGIVSHSQEEGALNVRRFWRNGWAALLTLLLFGSFFFPVLGTPARTAQRFDGWRPDYGTLNGLDYMREGVYTWPNGENRIELRYDWEAIQWLLDNVDGNPVIVESAEVEYYRAGGSHVASMTGLSGLRGMHASEQRHGDLVGERDGLHREFWDTPDVERTMALIDELGVGLIYVGQLERHQHPRGMKKLERMASDGLLAPIYTNDRVTIYAVPDALIKNEDGGYQPS